MIVILPSVLGESHTLARALLPSNRGLRDNSSFHALGFVTLRPGNPRARPERARQGSAAQTADS